MYTKNYPDIGESISEYGITLYELLVDHVLGRLGQVGSIAAKESHPPRPSRHEASFLRRRSDVMHSVDAGSVNLRSDIATRRYWFSRASRIHAEAITASFWDVSGVVNTDRVGVS